MSKISFTRWMAVIAALISAVVLLTNDPCAAQERIPDEIQYSGDAAGIKTMGLGPVILGATSPEVRDALDLIAADVVSISFGTSDSAGFEVFDTGATAFPTMGTDYFVMSTGATASALTANTSGSTTTVLDGLNTAEGEDLVQTVLVLQPPAGASCLAFDFAFYSEEFPEWVGSQYNDVFIAEIGESNFQEVDNQIIAPNNFAFDTEGNVVSVNTVFGVTAGDADGTTYDAGTPLLTAKTPLEVPGAQITITLSIMDLGDSLWDSTVFIDNFRWLYGVACEPGADADTDRDALLDGWESNGIDFDKDGTVDLDLPAMGADPMHKDVFIEIDYMVLAGPAGHSHKPKADALQAVIDAFASAAVDNPDGTTGIRAHIDAGSDTIMNPVSNATWGTRSESDVLTHQNNLGTCTTNPTVYNWSAFDGIKGVGVPGNFSIQRGDVFHYCIFAHSLCTNLGTTSGISRGIPASDFIVSLGGWDGDVGSVNQQAGTLMHEFGHNLGLLHGGDDGFGNYEPNYLSIMNYAFQMRGLRIGGSDGNLDYSRFQLRVLDETSLDETVGISGEPDAAGYGTRFYDTTGTQRIVNDINGAVDWNRDGDDTDTGVAADINGTAFSRGVGYCSISGDPCFNNAHCTGGADVCQQRTVLDNTDNWDEIVFNGGAVGALGEAVELPVEVDDPTIIDITELEDKAIPTEFKVSVTGPATVFMVAGKSTTYRYKVTNTGDNPDTFAVSAIAVQTWANLSSLPPTVELNPGESSMLAIPVSIPGSSLSGSTDKLTVTVNSIASPAMMDAAETITIVSIAAIDIKPGSDDNPVNANSKLIPVAILGSASFDVEDIDVTTLFFGPRAASPAHKAGGHPEDVNDDGLTDLVSHFRTAESGIVGAYEACLTGETLDSTPFGDCDPLKPLP